QKNHVDPCMVMHVVSLPMAAAFPPQRKLLRPLASQKSSIGSTCARSLSWRQPCRWVHSSSDSPASVHRGNRNDWAGGSGVAKPLETRRVRESGPDPVGDAVNP